MEAYLVARKYYKIPVQGEIINFGREYGIKQTNYDWDITDLLTGCRINVDAIHSREEAIKYIKKYGISEYKEETIKRREEIFKILPEYQADTVYIKEINYRSIDVIVVIGEFNEKEFDINFTYSVDSKSFEIPYLSGEFTDTERKEISKQVENKYLKRLGVIVN
jgi:hypothetical protein